jgi:hypothetical protein
MKKCEIIKALNENGFKISNRSFFRFQKLGLWQKDASLDEIKKALEILKTEKHTSSYERAKTRLTDGNA